MSRVRRCSRVLDEYHYEFRAPVLKKNLRGDGKRSLILGGDGGESPTMSALEPLCQEGWPAGIAEGVWFAGDDVFGGALLVPGSGELMFLQPLDGGALADERARAGTDRVASAQRAGLVRGSPWPAPSSGRDRESVEAPAGTKAPSDTPVPGDAVAFSHAGTREVWQRTRRRVVRRLWLWSALFLAAFVAGVALSAATGSADPPLSSAGPALAAVALFVYAIALYACLGALSRLRRARAVLEACAWQPLAGVRRTSGATEPTGVLVQLSSASDGGWSPSLCARDPLRWNRWNAALEQGAWFAGDVRIGGVLAQPGGHGLMNVQRPTRVLSAEERSARDDHERILDGAT